MKIAFFHNLPAGGAKRVIYEQVKYLSTTNSVDLYQLSSADKKFLDIREFCNNIFTYEFDLNVKNRIKRDHKNFITLKEIHRKIAADIDKNKYDIVITHPDKFTQAPYLLRFLKTKNIYFCHELLRICYEKELNFTDKVFLPKKVYENQTRKIRKHIDRINAQSANKIVTNSDYIKQKVWHAYRKRAIACPLGVDTKTFVSLSKKKNYSLLFLGSKSKIDGWNLIEEILYKLPEPKPDMNFVHFSGIHKVSDSMLSRIYSRNFLTICASYNEPFGLSPLESFACGTPVLAVNDGGYRETVINGKNGYLLGRDPQKFIDKIEYLRKNPKIYTKMSKFAIENVQKNWTWQKHNEKLLNIIKKL